MTNIAMSIKNIDSNMISDKNITYKDTITNYSVTNTHNGEIFSDEGESFQGSYTSSINNNSEEKVVQLIDFEEMIDSMTLNKNDLRLQGSIKELSSITLDADHVTLTTNSKSNTDIDYNNAKQDISNENSGETAVKDILKHESQENLGPANISTVTYDLEDNIDAINLTNDSQSTKENDTSIISISSEEIVDQNVSDDGYNSSDFEFITESEAAVDGYIINFNKDNNSNIKSDITSQETTQPDNKTENSRSSDEVSGQAQGGSGLSDPGEGPSGLNGSGRAYRQNHIVPEGDRYLDLFQGPYNPVLPLSDIIILENKSIRPSAMYVQYEGIGFDKQLIRRRCQPDSSEEEYADEAKESIKTILSMYSRENRRRRRKH